MTGRQRISDVAPGTADEGASMAPGFETQVAGSACAARDDDRAKR